MSLDKTDLAILRLLQTEGRLTNEDIGKREGVHKSASRVSERITQLEKEGYILGFRAVLNRKKLGFNYMISTLVMLEEHKPEAFAFFEKTITENFPNVIQWFRLQGSWDYMLLFATRDPDHYNELYMKLITLKNVHRTRSQTPMHVSEPGPLPLPA